MRILFIITAALAVMIPPAFGGAIVYFAPSSQVISPGLPSTVDVNVSGASGLYYWQFDLIFDPAVIQVSAVSEGTFLSNAGSTFFFEGFIDNAGGSVTFVADSLESLIPGANGDGTLATVDFAGAQNGTTDLTLQNVSLGDSSLNDITSTFTFQSGDVEVTPEPGSALLLGGALLACGAGLRRKFAA
jgi:hypothetical protein